MQTARALLNLITMNYFKHVHKLLDTLIFCNIYSLSGKRDVHGHTVIKALCQYEEIIQITMLKLGSKKLIFSRVKAYNLIQMFSFVTEIMEIFYQKKLLSLANNRIQTYIALRFQGINAQRLDKDDIQAVDNEWYKVQSQTTGGDYYSVNTHIGFCTCPKGRDGSPCLHQAAVVVQYGEYGLNFITSMSPSARQKLVRIALGDGAIKDPCRLLFFNPSRFP